MRVVVVGTVLVAACQPVPPSVGLAAPRQTLVTPPIPHADYDVVPAELADAGVLQRIKHRVRLRRIGAAWIRTDGEALARSSEGDAASVLPVLAETSRKIRVVVDDDDARLAIWIDRGDAMRTVLAPIQLADRGGRTSSSAGVWLAPGIAIEVAERAGDLREIHVLDEQLAVQGWLPPAAIGHVWVEALPAPAEATLDHVTVWSPPRDDRPLGKLANGTQVRAEGDRHALVLATTTVADVIGSIVARRGAYTEIEIFRPQLRVRGVVSTSAITSTTDDLSMHGSGSGHGFGMSHADRIDVPAGACLFDAADGEVVGVQLTPSTRYGSLRKVDATSWSLVFVDSPWALLNLYLHDTGSDPDHPVWEICKQ